MPRLRVVIAGLGLIGASLGLDLRQRGHEVLGLDKNPEHLRSALQMGAVEGEARGFDAVDVVLLAAPPLANVELLCEPWRARLVMDTSSVKEPLMRAARERELPFVGGHPLGGTAGGGPEAARAGLFRGRSFVLVAGSGPMDLARSVAEEVGAVPIEMEAGAHDAALARGSHLVYLISCALAGLLRDYPPELLGPAAYEMLRVATSPSPLWREILALNSEAVSAALKDFTEELVALPGDAASLDERRGIAERIRRQWNDAD